MTEKETNFDIARQAIKDTAFILVHDVTAYYEHDWDSEISSEGLAGAEIIEELLNSGKLSKEALEDTVTTVIGNNDTKYFEVEKEKKAKEAQIKEELDNLKSATDWVEEHYGHEAANDFEQAYWDNHSS